MKREDLIQVYDAEYAASYNERFLHPFYAKPSVECELGILRSLIGPDTKWLDVGCGTGYMLSQFPGVARAGLDKSPGMLTQARPANPDALFIQEGDFRDPHPEWQQAWSLVSCMWGAYIYVDSVQEVEQVVANLVSWLQPGGHLFLPIIDIEDMSRRPPKYEEVVIGFGGSTTVVGSIWNWFEHDSGRMHEHLVSPHVDHFLHLLAPHFETVELVRYPVPGLDWPSRKALVAKGCRVVPNPDRPAVITRQPIPEGPFPSPELLYQQASAAALPYQVLVAELARRFRPAHLVPAVRRRLGLA